MFDLQKVVSIIIVIIISVILTYISYFPYKGNIATNNNNKTDEYTFSSISTGKDGNLEEEKLSGQNDIKLSGIFLEKINSLDEIYFSDKDSYKRSKNGNNTKIELKSGLYAFNINDLSSNYNIYYNGFMLKPISIGKIFINTRENKKPLIFSLNSVFQLNLINEKSEILTKTYLYPHQYIKLDFTKNLGIRNIDSLRILTSFINGYVKDPLFKDGKVLEQLSVLFSSDDKESMNFLKHIYIKISLDINKADLEYKKYSSNFDNIENIKYDIDEGKVNDFSNHLFINSKKEAISYKNKLLLDTKNLFKNENLSEEEIISMSEDLKNLENVNIDEYKNTLNTLYDYSRAVIISRNSKIGLKNNFSKLLVKVAGKNESYHKSYLVAKYLYDDYDFGILNNFDKGFSKFLDEYIKEYNLNTLNNQTISANLDYVDSFLLFFSKVIKSKLISSSSNTDIDGLIDIINKYFLISNNYYFNTYSILPEHISNTGLYQNVQIIYMIDGFIYKNFFEESQDKDSLLVVKKINFNKEYINKLSSNIKNILNSIYNKKTDFLLEEDYKKLDEKFDKYFSAIIDYNLYKIKYGFNQ